MNATLALCAASPADGRLGEFLRFLVGLVAGGRPVSLLVTGAGTGLAEGDPQLQPAVERYLEALAESGIRPRGGTAQDVAAALRTHGTLLRLAPADRSAQPDLLVIDDARLTRAVGAEDEFLAELLAAGQVVRASPPRITT